MMAKVSSCQLLLAIAICCSTHASCIEHANKRLRSSVGLEHQPGLKAASLSTSVQDDVKLQKAVLTHSQHSGTGNNASQHLGQPQAQRVETPGSYMSRTIPDEWKPAVSWFATILLFGFFYKRLAFFVPEIDPTKAQDASESFKEWRHELFDCCGHPFFCMIACVFPSLVLADSLTKSRLGAFFAIVIVSGFLIALNFIVLLLPWVAFAMYCTFHRQQLRDAFEMENDSNSMCMDFLLYLFCNPCTLTQDARHIQEAGQAGHPAVEHDYRRLNMYF